MLSIQRYALHLAWLVAVIATGGSLYMSEILLWEPCKLCWVQRVFMYPLVLLLGIAAYRRDGGIFRYTLPLSIIGGTVSIYHYIVQKIPGTEDMSPCRTGVPCGSDYLNLFGWITIPLLALVAFALITILLFSASKDQSEER